MDATNPTEGRTRGTVLVATDSRIHARALIRQLGALGFAARVEGGEDPRPMGDAVLALAHDTPARLEPGAREQAPVIVFSTDRDKERAALEAGASDFLLAPCRAVDLADLIDRWLAMGAASTPRAPAEPAPEAEPSSTAARPATERTGRPRILLVDDSQVIHAYVEGALAPAGYEVLHAHDGREGLAAAIREQPDLVISDIDMPEMNGYEMCRAIKAEPQTQAIPIVILSARGTGVDIDLGFDVGANDFLTKPVSENELVTRVRFVLGDPDAAGADRETVLVVEDSAVQRRVVVQALAQQGFDVHEAENGEAGLKRALEILPDLIVTDSEMPVMNGRDLTRAVKTHERLEDVPVMMLTAADSDLARAKGRHAGVSAYLAKPFVADKVVVIAEKLVAERRLKRERAVMQRYMSTSAIEAASAAAGARGALDESMRAEMRFATVLFSDLVGFTPLTERLVPAKLVTLLNGYFDAVVPLVSEHGGVVDKLIGDAVMAWYVGTPGALGQRDQACAAVRTGLAMLAALEEYNRVTDEPLATRIGIHSGPMLMGDIGSRSIRRDYTALGDNVNIGARLESAAEPGTVLISEATYDLVRDRFEAAPCGPITVKGKAHPITVYRPLREIPTDPAPTGEAAT